MNEKEEEKESNNICMHHVHLILDTIKKKK